MTDVNLHLTFNTFDTIVLGILALSAVIAFFRGFLREFLSFMAWVGAAVITIYMFPHSDDMMRNYMKNPKLAAATGALATYFAALILISIINSIILRYVKTGMEVGLLDNFLGLVFGALRGAFIVCFGFLVLSAVMPKAAAQQPEWLKTSGTRPYLKEGADFLVEVAPKYIVEMESAIKKQVDNGENPQNYPPIETEKDFRPKMDSAIR